MHFSIRLLHYIETFKLFSSSFGTEHFIEMIDFIEINILWVYYYIVYILLLIELTMTPEKQDRQGKIYFSPSTWLLQSLRNGVLSALACVACLRGWCGLRGWRASLGGMGGVRGWHACVGGVLTWVTSLACYRDVGGVSVWVRWLMC